MTDVIKELVASFNKEQWRKALENANSANNAQFRRNPKAIKELQKILKKGD